MKVTLIVCFCFLAVFAKGEEAEIQEEYSESSATELEDSKSKESEVFHTLLDILSEGENNTCATLLYVCQNQTELIPQFDQLISAMAEVGGKFLERACEALDPDDMETCAGAFQQISPRPDHHPNEHRHEANPDNPFKLEDNFF